MIGLWLLGIFFPQKRRRWHPIVPFVILLLSFAIEFLVQTDREKILGAVNKGIKAFETQDIQPIKEIIADDYSDSAHSSKELIVAYCQALFETATVDKITPYSQKLAMGSTGSPQVDSTGSPQVKNNKAAFTIEGLVKFTEQSQMAQMGKAFLIVRTRFYFKKTPDRKWLIYSSEILELDRNPVNWNQLHE
jgi:hypothetical protein